MQRSLFLLTLAGCSAAPAANQISKTAAAQEDSSISVQRKLGDIVSCEEVYGKPSECEVMECSDKLKQFLGTWTGPFQSIIDFNEPSTYRPYTNTVKYTATDCLRSKDTGEEFIIGRVTDDFPAYNGLEAKVDPSLMVTGKTKDGQLFLRTISKDEKDSTKLEISPYDLAYKNDVAVMSAWAMSGMKDGNPYTISTVDSKDWTVADPAKENRRLVTVTLESGGFTKILVKGSHTQVK